LGLCVIERLAAADAMRSLGLDRRQALWEVKALVSADPLPLFAWGDASDAGCDIEVQLPAMAPSEHVVADYQTLRLSLKAHPVSFLRPRLTAGRTICCADLNKLRDGAWVEVAGVVLVRQRPGSAKGVVFMTIEDETGIANAVVWPKTLERYRKTVMGARLILIRGRIQRHDSIIHVVCHHLEDRTDWLADLMQGEALPHRAHSRAEEVAPSARDGTRGSPNPTPRHPRNVRVIDPPRQPILPRSRDFH
jgi:error-prone DNA polymerase